MIPGFLTFFAETAPGPLDLGRFFLFWARRPRICWASTSVIKPALTRSWNRSANGIRLTAVRTRFIRTDIGTSWYFPAAIVIKSVLKRFHQPCSQDTVRVANTQRAASLLPRRRFNVTLTRTEANSWRIDVNLSRRRVVW